MILYTIILVVVPVLVTSENTAFGAIEKVYQKCQKDSSPIKCLKVQVLKAVSSANLLSSIKIANNFELVKVGNYSRSFTTSATYEKGFEKLNSDQVDEVLWEAINQFWTTHSLQINTPRLMEESRGNKMQKYIGPIIAAIGMKSALFTMAYKGIAVIAGAALIAGKIALVLTTILVLKYLVHHEHDKTTVEIVKHPHYSHKHTHSTSHDEFGGHHFKNLNSEEEMMMQDKTYKSSLPLPYQYQKF